MQKLKDLQEKCQPITTFNSVHCLYGIFCFGTFILFSLLFMVADKTCPYHFEYLKENHLYSEYEYEYEYEDDDEC